MIFALGDNQSRTAIPAAGVEGVLDALLLLLLVLPILSLFALRIMGEGLDGMEALLDKLVVLRGSLGEVEARAPSWRESS